MYRVFVLGSGFSVEAGAPLSRSVLTELFNSNRGSIYLKELKEFLGSFLFQGREDWITDSNLEEVLSRLDLIRHYKPYPDVDYDKVAYYEELLLNEFTKLLMPERTQPWHKSYELFRDVIRTDDTIISFNYDLIMEKLLESTGKRYTYKLNGENQVSDQETVTILKLHGSVNLYYCPNCGKVYYVGEFHKKRVECQFCASQGNPETLRYYIIAPTLFKSYALKTLRNIWYLALQAMASAGEIFFIGYSLPEADVLSYQLFDYSKRLSNKGQKCYLINGPKHLPDKFNQIYGQDLVNTGCYFEEWTTMYIERE